MFDRYVAQTQPNWKRRGVVIASLVLHGIAAVVLVVWSFFHVDEIAPPAVSLTFFSAPPPPPPPPPPAGKKKTEKKQTPKTETKVVQPTDVPKLVQPKVEEKEEEKDDGEEGGVEGGVKGGVQGGVVGGVQGGVVGGTGTGGGPAKMVAAFTLSASQLQHPLPTLPDFFKNQHAHQNMQGTYKVCLDMSGRVSSVSAMAGIGGVDDGVMGQIKSMWTYKPQKTPVCFAAVVKFQIN